MVQTILKTFLVLIPGFFACNNSADQTAATPTETPSTITTSDENQARQMPAFTMVDQSGNQVELSQFNGKKVFVNLWASWCPPCRREMPSIQKLYRSVDTSKVAFVLLALDDDFEVSKKYTRSQKLDLPLYFPAGNVPAMFNVPSIPTTFIFDEKGNLLDKVEGSDDYDTDRYRKMLK